MGLQELILYVDRYVFLFLQRPVIVGDFHFKFVGLVSHDVCAVGHLVGGFHAGVGGCANLFPMAPMTTPAARPIKRPVAFFPMILLVFEVNKNDYSLLYE